MLAITLFIYHTHRKKVKMSDAIEDPYAYTRLTDNVVQQILLSTEPQLQKVHIIILTILKLI